MAKLTIEIDTGKLGKLKPRADETVCEMVRLIEEATSRLKGMGADADGVILYGRDGPRGKITLVESGEPEPEPEGCREEVCWCHDPSIPLEPPVVCSHCGCQRVL